MLTSAMFTTSRWYFLGIYILLATKLVYYIVFEMDETTTVIRSKHVTLSGNNLGQGRRQNKKADNDNMVKIPQINQGGRPILSPSSDKTLHIVSHRLVKEKANIKLGYLSNALNAEVARNIHSGHLIIFWHGSPETIPVGDTVFHSLKCPVQTCKVSYNRSLLEKASAVVFTGPLLSDPIPKRPNLQQRWIFWSQESPLLTQPSSPLKSWNNLFNWTATYRPDSDFVLSFGGSMPQALSRKRQRTKNELIRVAKSKPKLAAWFVRNCNTPSHREDYVRELMTYIHVGVYGECAVLQSDLPTMHWGSKDREVLSMLNKTYLFYLAFENSFCEDYVTEKFYKVMPYDVVPVVRGAANYTRLVPHKWFIDSADFRSPRHLADYLKHLQQHPEEYVRYLQNRDNFHFDFTLWRESKVLCQLCEKLNNPSEPMKTYPYIDDWWSTKDCREPQDLNITKT